MGLSYRVLDGSLSNFGYSRDFEKNARYSAVPAPLRGLGITFINHWFNGAYWFYEFWRGIV